MIKRSDFRRRREHGHGRGHRSSLMANGTWGLSCRLFVLALQLLFLVTFAWAPTLDGAPSFIGSRSPMILIHPQNHHTTSLTPSVQIQSAFQSLCVLFGLSASAVPQQIFWTEPPKQPQQGQPYSSYSQNQPRNTSSKGESGGKKNLFPPTRFFNVSLDRSTEENYKSNQHIFYGEYAYIRSQLDYSYHSVYTKERQLLQDTIIHQMLENATNNVMDHVTGRNCTAPTRNWLVLTAGAMGAGKSYTIRRLSEQGLFPLEAFVAVDPDEIRRLLPEFERYVQQTPQNAGELTRKEAGYISEILTLVALQRGQNVLIDGSLRNSSWYAQYFEKLRHDYQNIQIAILHVTAPREAVFERAANRSLCTGRVVPYETLKNTIEQVPKSVQELGPLSDFFVELHNPPDANGIELRTEGTSWDSFQSAWRQQCPPSDGDDNHYQ